MKPFSELPPAKARQIRYVLHDIDDTITNEGKLLPQAYEALWRLRDAGIRVIPVTGRPGGWCDMILRQWPVEAVIGENGAFVCYLRQGKPALFYYPGLLAPEENARRLKEIQTACLEEVPGCRVSKDQHYRLYDLAIDFNEDEPRLGFKAAEKIKAVCERFGAQAKISSIHVNTWFGTFDKVSMAKLFFREILGESDLSGVLFFGDSANDEPMFEAIPLSCGVSNIQSFLPLMKFHPGYLSDAPGGKGFAAAVDTLLKLRSL